MNFPNRRRFLRFAVGACAVSTLDSGIRRSAWAADSLARVTRRSKMLGTNVAITALASRTEAAHAAIELAFDEMRLVERLMSIYRDDSQLSRLNKRGTIAEPHPHLVAILREATRTAAATNGAFDVTVAPLWDLFSQSGHLNQLPSSEEVARVQKLVDWRGVEITDRRIRLRQKGAAITLNGIAQGFATDRAVAVLREQGIEHALIDTGELGSLGSSSDGKPWSVGVQHPRQEDAFVSVVDLEGRCLATSGDYATRFSDDCRHHHIFDPQTGYSPTELSSATIVAPTGTMADALSTATLVMGSEAAMRLVTNLKRVDALFVLKNGETRATPGFPERPV